MTSMQTADWPEDVIARYLSGSVVGTWPNGERKSVRDAYDRILAEQAAAQSPST